MRPMTVRVALSFVAAAVLVAGCTSGEPDRYTVAWQMGADEYDDAKADAAVSRCTEMAGAGRADGEPASLPPVPQLTFRGSDQDRQRFEDCLLALDDAVIYGPVAPDDDSPRAPVLKR